MGARESLEGRLSPPQDRVLAQLAHRVREAGETGRGKIVFIAGQPGSGKSHLLRAAAARLRSHPSRPRIAMGGFDLRPDEPAAHRPETAEQAISLLGSAASAAASLDPSTALVAPILDFSLSAVRLLDSLDHGREVERTELVTRVIRAAAREEPRRPLLCLVDDAEWLGGAWWTELRFAFAREVAEELPLVLALALEGDPDLPEDPALDCHPAWRSARSLAGRGIADWEALSPLTDAEVRAWLGQGDRAARSALLDLSGGRSGEAAGLWRSWLALGVITEDANGWSVAQPDGISKDAVSELSRRIEHLLRDRDRGRDDEIVRVLSCGALEGRTFTSAAVAEALEADPESVEDLLDTLVDDEDPDRGILRPPLALKVEDPMRRSAQTVWRYRFTSPLVWRALGERLVDPELVPELADRLGNALYRLYGREYAIIAPSLARLALLAGEPDAASHFRSLLSSTDLAVLQQRARLLLAADNSAWTVWDNQDAALLLAEAVEALWDTSPSSVLLQHSEAAMKFAEATGPGGRPALGRALFVHGWVLTRLGRVAEGEECLRAVRQVSAGGDQSNLADALRKLADLIVMQKRDYSEAKALLEEAVSLHRQIGNRGGEMACKYDLAGLYFSAGDLESARPLTEEALEYVRGEGDEEKVHIALHQLADIEHGCGNHEIARRHLETVLRYLTETGNPDGEASALRILAQVELSLGNVERARDLGLTALEMLRELEDANGEAVALVTLARVCKAAGERERARDLVVESRRLALFLDSPTRAAAIDEEFADLL